MSALTLQKPQITIQGDILTTTSTDVAKFFGRKHKNVIQTIENLKCSSEFTSANFSAHVKTVAMPKGATRQDAYYEMTQDGFTILAMGFTGAKAMVFKEVYIKTFRVMETELLQKYKQAALPETLTSSQQRSIQETVAALSKEDGAYAKHYGNLKTRFRVGTYKDIPSIRFDDAMTYLVGEYVPEDKLKSFTPEVYTFPEETARPTYKLDDVLNASTLLDERYDSPLVNLLKALNKQGHDVGGAIIELKAMRHTIEVNAMMFASIKESITTRQHSGLNFNHLASKAVNV